jgi:endonuclease/exonuclease/phosphatase family metal-dependent hydrolase
MKILSLNILCGTYFDPLPINRFKIQIRQIIALNPDVICLQEFNNFIIEYLYKKYLSENYNFIIFHISILEYIRRILLLLFVLCITKYVNIFLFLFVIINILNPYFFQFFLGNQKTGNAILLKKTIHFKNPTVYTFKNQLGDFLNIIRHRGFLKCEINGITFINTHLNNSNYNQNQIQELIYQNCESKIIICGDFNTENIHLFDKYNFKNKTHLLGFTYRNENSLVPFYIKSKIIDYIFYKNITIKYQYKLDLYSDHDALLIEIL